jgi:hypothetical protein
MSQEENLPDWLKQLRDQQLGAPEAGPAEAAQPADQSGLAAPAEAPPPPPPPEKVDELDALRQIASAEPLPEEEPRRSINIPIVSELTPFQRFVLALMLFLNVSVLGCLFLAVTERISFVR